MMKFKLKNGKIVSIEVPPNAYRYTGYTVDNKDLYESDIVRWRFLDPINIEKQHICKVIWSDEFCGWALENLTFPELKAIPIGMYGALLTEIHHIMSPEFSIN